MALILSCTGLSKSYGSRLLFENISLGISEGERLGLIGANGSGKSTLLKILAGRLDPDSGSISLRRNTRIGYVAQDVTGLPDLPASEVIASAVTGEHLDKHERASRVHQALGRAGFTDGSVRAGTLSGGWKRRLAIARELAAAPDLLFLDEPTNHLDLEGILWLERLLAAAPFATVVVSHDRYFLDHVVNEMAELGRVWPDGIFRVEGSYTTFLEKKQQFLEAQANRQEALENRVKREVEWLRRNPKARTGKSRARTAEAGRLTRELSDLESRSVSRTAAIDFTSSGRRTKRLAAVENLSKSYGKYPGQNTHGKVGNPQLFHSLNFVLTPGTRLGLLGPNGSGKTTLLKILAGELQPDSGEIVRAEALRTVYFDQTREQIDPSATLREGLGAHGDTVIFRDRPIHVAGWAKRFLFGAGQLDRPISSLSGGEQARVLIARLMLQPADLLLLDEPTNDLDIPTLEVLEDNLTDFPGALMLVTHDRYLLDRVSTAVLGLDGEGGWQMFADYWQWEQARAEARARSAPEIGKIQSIPSPAPRKKKLSYLEAREIETMEARILEAEQELERLRALLQAPDVVADGARLRATYTLMQAAEARVEELYNRWAELETRRG